MQDGTCSGNNADTVTLEKILEAKKLMDDQPVAPDPVFVFFNGIMYVDMTRVNDEY